MATAEQIYVDIDLHQNQILNPSYHRVDQFPKNPKIGQFCYLNSKYGNYKGNVPYFFDGLSWRTYGSDSAGGISSIQIYNDVVYNAVDDSNGNWSGSAIVEGLLGYPLPQSSNGFLKFNGSEWIFDNNQYLTKTPPLSAGITEPIVPILTNLGSGNFTISSTKVALYSSNNFTGDIQEYIVPSRSFTLTSNTIQYLCISYNNGSPIYYLENDEHNINGSNIVCTYHIWLAPTGTSGALEIHSISLDSRGIGLSNKISDMLERTNPYNLAYGDSFILSESNSPAVRTLLISNATVFAGVDLIEVLSLNSSTIGHRLTNVYRNAGVWTYSNTVQYNNTQYDNGVDLVSLGTNRYSVRWIYRSIGDDVQAFYYCSGNYSNQAEAEADKIPNGLPVLVQEHCVLVGRLIIKNGLDEAISIQNVVTTSFSSSNVNSHNNLNGLQGQGPEYYHLNQSEYSSLLDIPNTYVNKNTLVALQEPTGFLDQTSSTLSFNNTTRTFTISPTSTTFPIYYRGTRYDKSSESIVISNTKGLHFIYYDSSATLIDSLTVWDFKISAPVALVYWTGTSALTLCDERHSTAMDWATHKYLHSSFGTRYISGFTPSYYIGSDIAIGFGLSSGIIADEDIEIAINNGPINGYFTQPINNIGQIPVYYRTGLDNQAGGWTKDAATSRPYKGGPTIAFNSLSSGTWGQTSVSTNNYVSYFIYATDNIAEPIISIQGQRQDSNLASAVQNNNPQSLLLLDLPIQEAKLLYRIILQYNPSYLSNPFMVVITQVDDYRNQLSPITNTSGGSGTVTSVNISTTTPSTLSITGSPITSAGTINIAFNPPTISLTGDVIGSGTTSISTTISDSTITNKLLTGFALGTNSSILSTDSILSAFGKTQSQINSFTSDLANYLPLSAGSGKTITGNLYLNSGVTQYMLHPSGDHYNVLISANGTKNTSGVLRISGSDGTYIRALGLIADTVASQSPNYFFKTDGSIDTNSYLVASGGIANRIPKWANSSSLTNSLISDDNVTVYIAGDLSIATSFFMRGSGFGTYNTGAVFCDSTGIGIGRPRSSDSGTASIRSFYVSQRGGGTWYFEVADGTTYHRQPVVSTSHLTLNGATRPTWGSGRNSTMLGGTVSIGQVYSGGDYLILHNNSYYDGTNNRSISATGYSSEMFISPEGGLSFNTVANSGANGIVNYPTARFVVDKHGNVVVPGSVQAGNSMHATWAWDGTYAWFGHSSQNNGVNGYSGILHRNDGTIVIYSPTGKAMYLGIGTSTVMQIDAGQVNVTGNGSFTGAVDAGNARMQTSALGSAAWFGAAGKNTSSAYIGYYAYTDGGVRIASSSGNSVNIGTGANYDALIVGDSGVRLSNLTSGGIVKANATTGLLTLATVSDLPYLPLSGGTLTGALSGTSASFSGNIGTSTGTMTASLSAMTTYVGSTGAWVGPFWGNSTSAASQQGMISLNTNLTAICAPSTIDLRISTVTKLSISSTTMSVDANTNITGSLYSTSSSTNIQQYNSAKGGSYLTTYIDGSNSYSCGRLQLAYNNLSGGSNGTVWNLDSYQGQLRIFGYTPSDASRMLMVVDPDFVQTLRPCKLSVWKNAINAESGDVGEYVTAAINNQQIVPISETATAVDVLSIYLTEGDWDVWSNIVFSANVSGTTRARAYISDTSLSTVSDGYEADGTIVTTSGAKLTMPLAKRINVSVPKTIYLTAILNGTFGVGTCWGNISARRIR